MQFPNFDKFVNAARAGSFMDVFANTFRLVDRTDPTKRVAFDVSGLTAATERTWTIPDTSGPIPMPQLARIDAARSLVDDDSDQAVFASAGDALSVVAGGTYMFDGMYSLTKGTNDVDTFMLFAGTATLTSIRYFVLGKTATNNAAAITNMEHKNVAVATEIEVAANGVGTNVRIQFHGMLEVNAAGTFIPQVNFSAATGSTPTVEVDSYFRMVYLGGNPLTALGPWA